MVSPQISEHRRRDRSTTLELPTHQRQEQLPYLTVIVPKLVTGSVCCWLCSATPGVRIRRNAFRPWSESWNRSWACARTGGLLWCSASVRPCRPASNGHKTIWRAISARNRLSEPSSFRAGRKPRPFKPKSCVWKTSTRPKNGQKNPILNWPSCAINWQRPRNGNCEPGTP